MVNPPKPGEPSYALYEKETTAIYESLKRRAVKLVEGFRKMEGVTCNYSQVRAHAGFLRATGPSRSPSY